MAHDALTRAQLKELRAAGKEHTEQLLIRAAADARIRSAADTIARIVAGLSAAVPAAELGKAAGLTVEEITALAEAVAPARRTAPAPLVERTMAAAGDLVTLAGVTTAPGLSDRFARRTTLFVHLGGGLVYDPATGKGWKRAPGMTLGALLTEMLGTKARRVFLCDAPDWCVTPDDKGRMSAVIRWLGQDIPGWQAGQHYVAESDTPTGKWTHTATGHAVEVSRAGAWYGPAGEFDPREAGRAWAVLDQLIGELFRDDYRGPGMLLSTPATTGQQLWLHKLGKRTYPILSPDLRQLIKSTSGQGRQELLAPRIAELPEVRQYDGRLMYGALTFGMPSGPPVMHRGEPDDARSLAGPGRWRITATVPDGWDHVGMLAAPVLGTGGAWRYPADPGEPFDTWTSGRELSLARSRGWDVRIHEGFSFPSGKVLDPWADGLKAAVSRTADLVTAGQETPAVGGLVERAVRFILLHSIGGFASSSHKVLRTAPADRPELANDAKPIDGIRREDDLLVWHERGQISAWQEQTSHPEYSAEIWARARVRLLQGPHDQPEMGALSLARADVIAFDLDALYISADPRWEDDGKAGRLRLKATAPGPLPYPGSLQALRDIAKGG